MKKGVLLLMACVMERCEGGGIVEIRAGGTTWWPAGGSHWQGATPDHGTTYVATQEEPDGKGVEFGERVTNGECRKGPRSAHHGPRPDA